MPSTSCYRRTFSAEPVYISVFLLLIRRYFHFFRLIVSFTALFMGLRDLQPVEEEGMHMMVLHVSYTFEQLLVSCFLQPNRHYPTISPVEYTARMDTKTNSIIVGNRKEKFSNTGKRRQAVHCATNTVENWRQRRL